MDWLLAMDPAAVRRAKIRLFQMALEDLETVEDCVSREQVWLAVERMGRDDPALLCTLPPSALLEEVEQTALGLFRDPDDETGRQGMRPAGWIVG